MHRTTKSTNFKQPTKAFDWCPSINNDAVEKNYEVHMSKIIECQNFGLFGIIQSKIQLSFFNKLDEGKKNKHSPKFLNKCNCRYF